MSCSLLCAFFCCYWLKHTIIHAYIDDNGNNNNNNQTQTNVESLDKCKFDIPFLWQILIRSRRNKKKCVSISNGNALGLTLHISFINRLATRLNIFVCSFVFCTVLMSFVNLNRIDDRRLHIQETGNFIQFIIRSTSNEIFTWKISCTYHFKCIFIYRRIKYSFIFTLACQCVHEIVSVKIF